MHIYCLFCLTAHVPAIRKILESAFSCTVLQASILQRKWVKGSSTDESHDYLPGYLFIYSDEPLTDLYQITRMEGVIRFLRYESEDGYEIRGNDRTFAESILATKGLISYVPVYQEGDRLTVKNGLFQGQRAEIKKVDDGCEYCAFCDVEECLIFVSSSFSGSLFSIT